MVPGSFGEGATSESDQQQDRRAEGGPHERIKVPNRLWHEKEVELDGDVRTRSIEARLRSGLDGTGRWLGATTMGYHNVGKITDGLNGEAVCAAG